MTTEKLEKVYDPKTVEAHFYKYWEEGGYFRADENKSGEPYTIVIPPPNVTGTLHLGHALDNTIQDILIRYHRMKGYNTLWLPGTDHAGIATQNVVERQLAEEGTSKEELGREKFVERVWEWRKQYGGIIINQLKRLGSSCDWSRERFTMDEGLSIAVKEVFVTLYEQGLLYQGDRIINWCPRCETALADIEVEHKDLNAHLYYVRYPLAEGDGHLIVATTRPETMLGDTAVAVNPQDPRYKDYIGREVILPILKKRIPVIGDDYVDVEFGTGALKITPAHDPNDFEIGLKHNLPMVKCIDDTGRMNEEAGPYKGQDRLECRKNIVADLKKEGLLEKIKDYQHAVGHCYRCKTLVEPALSKQWFVKVKPLAEKAIQAVQEDRTRIIPSNWEKTYFEWMNNIRDWCVSRQLWWGHRIPAYYCQDCGEVMVSREPVTICSVCQSSAVEQDSDVLDTWFSSGLWPFSTLGWPKKTKELTVYYPTSVLVTAFDILFFWVARMMMLGIHFMDEVPFGEVYIHALVRDPEGQKMSKSKGNVTDPLEIMDKYGTDAFRFTLAVLAAKGRDIRLSEERIAGYGHFVNKLWNAARFTLMNLDGFTPERLERPVLDEKKLTLADAWIMSRLSSMVTEVEKHMAGYDFDQLANALYQFVWHEFCDWYLELVKPVLYGEDLIAKKQTQAVLAHVLSAILRMLHPIMPFVTEQIWQKMPGVHESIMISPFPDPEEGRPDPKSEREMQLTQNVITAIRNVRGEMNVPPSLEVEVIAMDENQKNRQLLKQQSRDILKLVRGKSLETTPPKEKPEGAAATVAGSVEVFVKLKGLINFDEEARRLQKELEKIEKEITRSNKKLANEDFLAKAPVEVVTREKEKGKVLKEKREKLAKNLDRVEALKG
ncbi:MAG: valine--tRNA ligase [Deltaproteobacteria bacterium]|nr:valine--tRNA ligase [Deltaproteobacteria bacterium]MBW2053511.1 valine--tRNA ligase [Deltaproteobacteria bacterium]MBW2142099.1 valine--tRNA ligase [Deltaproteobacteria bacterium]MBW2323923.1 valine--tRNA ligase [Deltaproteobacteria bacterium]